MPLLNMCMILGVDSYNSYIYKNMKLVTSKSVVKFVSLDFTVHKTARAVLYCLQAKLIAYMD